MRMFVLVSKVLPMVLAFLHLVNTILNLYYIDIVFFNYFASVSILTVGYFYLISYAIHLCGYYRMYLHYIVFIDIISIIDHYIGIPVKAKTMLCIYVIITIITMFTILYMKFFKK